MIITTIINSRILHSATNDLRTIMRDEAERSVIPTRCSGHFPEIAPSGTRGSFLRKMTRTTCRYPNVVMDDISETFLHSATNGRFAEPSGTSGSNLDRSKIGLERSGIVGVPHYCSKNYGLRPLHCS